MKYHFFDGQPGWTGFKIVEIEDYDQMIERVRQYQQQRDHLPTVFYGERLEFEPAEIVKSWRLKEKR